MTERERERTISSYSTCTLFLSPSRSWLLANSEDDEIRKSPPVTTTQNLHVRKPRGSTIRREDQQLYDNAIGKSQ